MKCYYEILGVPLDATPEEIKKSYRKAALQCHPDKNADREVEAAEEFKEIGNAYANLSDPQLRAFYDRNKDNILRAEEKGTFTDKIFKYFSTRCFKGFEENPENFYNVYRKYFDDLVQKDAKYRKAGSDEPPSFGNSSTDLVEVAGFYAYWSSYSTAMPFAWIDKYNINDARSSSEEKVMAVVNKELRDKERKDFNERVRNLVLYIKKKDPRWEERVRLMNERNEESQRRARERQEKEHKERLDALEEEMRDEKHVAARREYLERVRRMERMMDWAEEDKEGNVGDDLLNDEALLSEDEDDDSLTCPVCIIFFNNEWARDKHMKSKKHRIRLDRFLKAHNLLDDAEESTANEETAEKTAASSLDEASKAEEVSCQESDYEADIPATSLNKKNKKKRKLEKLAARQEKIRAQQNKSCVADNSDKNVEDISEKLSNAKIDNRESTEESEHVNEQNETDKPSETCEVQSLEKLLAVPEIKKNKKLQKSKNECSNNKSRKKNKDDIYDDVEVEHSCQICKHEFPSKNKLFQHIKSTGHAALKTDAPSKQKGRRRN